MHNHTDRITQTTAFVTPVVEHWLEGETTSQKGHYLMCCLVSLNNTLNSVTPVVKHWLEREMAHWVHQGSTRRPAALRAMALTSRMASDSWVSMSMIWCLRSDIRCSSSTLAFFSRSNWWRVSASCTARKEGMIEGMMEGRMEGRME